MPPAYPVLQTGFLLAMEGRIVLTHKYGAGACAGHCEQSEILARRRERLRPNRVFDPDFRRFRNKTATYFWHGKYSAKRAGWGFS